MPLLKLLTMKHVNPDLRMRQRLLWVVLFGSAVQVIAIALVIVAGVSK